MTKLFGELPMSVMVDGKDYKINTDFRVWIEIEELLNSSEMSEEQRFARCLILAYPKLPPSPHGALEALMEFYCAGRMPSSSSAAFGGSGRLPLYSIAEDAPYIYGSFLAQYGIDLSEAQLHWWKFRALLACLSDECKFAQVVSYRNTDTHAISDPEKKRFYERMKRIYALPDNRTDAERATELCECMECLF